MLTFQIPAERFPLYDRILFLLFVVAGPIALGSVPFIFSDGDVSWHVATGQWILAHGIPSSDPFSHTMAGRAWVAHEWLPDIVLGAAYDVAGFHGLSLVVVASLAALNAIVFSHLRQRVAPIAVFLALLGANAVLIPFTLARPHVLIWPVLAIWTVMLTHYRDAGRAPPLPWALLLLLWTNMHGSFPLGLIVAACMALDALVTSHWDRKLLTGWLVFGLCCGVAAIANANGLAGIEYPFATMSMEVLPMIQEWMPSSPTLTPVFYFVLVGALGLILFRGAPFSLGELLLLMLLLLMALSQVRHQSWLAIVGAILVPLRAGWARPTPTAVLLPPGWPAWIKAGGAIAAVACAVLVHAAMPVGPKDIRFDAQALLRSIPIELRDKPVFNEYSLGGPLILAGVRPYIDGRADMYGDPFIAEYRRIIDGDKGAFDRAVTRYGIRWVIVPGDSIIARKLTTSEAWEPIHSEAKIAIYVSR